ncbi:hypothetical protein D3C81_1889330 [compost metagenome]
MNLSEGCQIAFPGDGIGRSRVEKQFDALVIEVIASVLQPLRKLFHPQAVLKKRGVLNLRGQVGKELLSQAGGVG